MESPKQHNNWVKLYATQDLQQAHLIKGLLENNEINCVIVNKKDGMNLFIQVGMIELHVSQDDFLKAKHILSKSEL